MKSPSLKLRLLLISAISIAVALALAGVGLVFLFSRHVERRIDQELETYINQIAGNLVFSEDGSSFTIKWKLPDPRFERPLSGLYWRVSDARSGVVRRSRSLWDTDLQLPDDVVGKHDVHRHILPGPAEDMVIVAEREISYSQPDGDHRVRIAVAIDESELVEARRSFAADLLPSLLVLCAFLIAATWIQISIGLRPLQAIRAGIASIREDRATRLTGAFPEEVLPLVHEVNTLLAEQEKAMDHARARAADLAHGLKTPLTVLGGHAHRLSAAGNAAIGDELAKLAADMQRHVDHQLALARLQSRGRGRRDRVDLAQVLKALVRTLQKTPRGGTLSWTITAPDTVVVIIDKNDLTEMLGNILENAVKWAASQVAITVAMPGAARAGVSLRITDDGPGFPDNAGVYLGERGVRFDESASGSGLGLAIVRDIAESYGIDLAFANGSLGGAEISLTFPDVP